MNENKEFEEVLDATLNETDTCECSGHECGHCECEGEQHDGHEHMSKKKEIEKLKEEIETLKKEVEISKNAYFKAYADTENTKRRLQQDFDSSNKYKLHGFMKEILPIIDNLERALVVNSENEECINYAKGFQMIYTQLFDLLIKEGVSEIEAMDKPFDPNFHQALMAEPIDGVESGKVVGVLQKGYMYKDRIVRPTLVKVSE